MELHNPFKFKVGQWVEVADKATSPAAWYGAWTTQALSLLGKRVKVLKVHDHIGYECESRRIGRACLPSTVLRVPDKKSVVVEVPSV